MSPQPEAALRHKLKPLKQNLRGDDGFAGKNNVAILLWLAQAEQTTLPSGVEKSSMEINGLEKSYNFLQNKNGKSQR
ncbi:MAG: hypothetical protein WBA57_23985 [Elainellaceae cyanobacterium]